MRWVLILALATGLAWASERPEPAEWFAGDPHVHRDCGQEPKHILTPRELLAGMDPNDLAVISVLADMGNGEVRDATEDLALITGSDHPLSAPQRILHWDAEWHFDPKGVTFEQKVLGGHLIVLGLKRGERRFAEYNRPIFEWAGKQGAVAGFAHMQYLPEGISEELSCCLPLEYPVETALGSSRFLMEDVDGRDTAIHGYYRLLNCGFRPALVAATDYPCNFGEPFGTLLTYVRIPGARLSYRAWVDGLARGRTVVSRKGHSEFLDLKLNRTAGPGDELRLPQPGQVNAEVIWSAAKPVDGTLEIVRNGEVLARAEGHASAGKPAPLRADVDFARSGWIAARRVDSKGHQIHTGAVFVTVGRAPVRASVADAEFFVAWIDHLIRKTSPGGEWNQYFATDLPAVHARYRKARDVFRRIAAEAQLKQNRD